MRSRTGKPRDEEPRESARAKTKASETVRVPHDPVNEMVVIGAALADSEARRTLVATISPDSFFGEHHAIIWAALREMEQRKLAWDPATLRQMAPSVDHDYVAQLLKQRAKAPDAATLRHHVECLHQDRARIDIARGPLQEFLEAIRDPRTQPERLRGIADRIARGLQGQGSKNLLRHGTAVARLQREALTNRRDGLAYRPFGIRGLDFDGDEPRLLPGTINGQLTVVTGLSGSGKSTTMANAILGMVEDGRKLLLGAWEMGAGMTLELLATIALGYSRSDMIKGRYSDEELDRLEAKMQEIGESVRFFELPFGRARGKINDQQLDLIQSVVIDSGCDVFVADLFRRALKETDPDDEEQALYRMQAMAQETNAHFILVQQQRLKDIEARAEKFPTREGIKGSGAWVEVADQIIGWHRPAQWKNVPDDKIEAFVLKQRYGKWPLRVELEWDPEFGYIGAGKTVRVDTGYEDDGNPDEDLDAFLSSGKSNAPPKKRR